MITNVDIQQLSIQPPGDDVGLLEEMSLSMLNVITPECPDRSDEVLAISYSYLHTYLNFGRDPGFFSPSLTASKLTHHSQAYRAVTGLGSSASAKPLQGIIVPVKTYLQNIEQCCRLSKGGNGGA